MRQPLWARGHSVLNLPDRSVPADEPEENEDADPKVYVLAFRRWVVEPACSRRSLRGLQ
jgi:hypothetical protein